MAELGRTWPGNAYQYPRGSLVEHSARFAVDLDGWRVSIQLWEEGSLDVVRGSACSLLACVASPQRHPRVLLARELCMMFRDHG
jgi:hypothetical protein